MRNTMLKRVFSAFMSVVLAMGLAPTLAFGAGADESSDQQSPVLTIGGTDGGGAFGAPTSLQLQSADVVASGIWGTCPWELDANGKLTVHPGVGADTKWVDNGDWYSDHGFLSSPWQDYAGGISSIVFVAEGSRTVIAPECCSSLFRGLSNVTSVDLSDFDTSKATDMSCMFYGCSSITSLSLWNLDTSAVTNMNEMFSECSSLAFLGISHFDTSNVTDMDWMFSDCSSLSSLDVSNFDTSAVQSMVGVFYGCSSLTSLDLAGLNTSNVVNMSYMFCDCSGLTTLGLSGLDTSNVSIMDMMFYGCSSLLFLDLSSFDMSEVEYSDDMFNGCTALVHVVVGTGFEGMLPSYEISSHTDWLSTNTESWYTSEQIAHNRKGIADTYIKSRQTVLASGIWGTCPWELTTAGALTVHPGTGADTKFSGYDSNTYAPWNDFAGAIHSIVFVAEGGRKVVAPSSCDGLFQNLSNLTSADFSGFDTSKTTSMKGMFDGCSSLETLNLSGFDTSKTEDMAFIFSDCSSLRALDLSGFNTSKMTGMVGMFSRCSSLETLDLSSFDTSKVENMMLMFYDCSSLESLDLSSFDMANVEYMHYMFDYCSQLAHVTVGTGFTGTLPSYAVSGHEDWLSMKTGNWFTSDQIAEDRKGIADTYIKSRVDITAATVRAANQTYTGQALKPAPTVTLDGNMLKAGTDYTVSYENNTNAGTATVVVTGKGAYFGTNRSGKFKINAANLGAASIAKIDNQAYSGKALKPALTIKFGGKVLKSGADYTAVYQNSTKAGSTATVTVTGKGNYAGVKKTTFKIVKAAQPMTASGSTKTAKAATLKTKAVTLTKTITVKKAKGAVSYKNVSTQKAAKKFKVNAKNAAITLPKATKKGTYTVKVKVTAKGNANYKAGSKTVAVKVMVK